MLFIFILITGVAYYNSKVGCNKCTIIGRYSKQSQTVVFARTGCPKRTDEGFRARVYDLVAEENSIAGVPTIPKYHKYKSPVEELEIDMVKQFVVGDRLHLLHLGNMKKLLTGWISGDLGYDTKWSALEMFKINEIMKKIKFPKEFKRKVRGINEISHWKGSEYGSFLHYLSITVLKDSLPLEYYQHFLLFFCAITICSSKFLLNTYIESFITMYGEQFIVSNVHNLTHIVDEVREFGELSTFDTYPFESCLYQLKRLLRHGYLPLEQVARRITEYTVITSRIEQNKRAEIFPKLKGQNTGETERKLFALPDKFFYSAKFKEFVLIANDEQNKWVLSKNNDIVSITNIAFLPNNNKLFLIGKKLKNVKDFFEVPMKSTLLNIYCSDDAEPDRLNVYDMDTDFKCKLVALNYNKSIVFIPLCHSEDKNNLEE